MLLEDVDPRRSSPLLFPGQTILESAAFRLARDAELELDDEGGRTYLEVVEEELRKRRRSDVVRLEVEPRVGDDAARAAARRSSSVDAEDVYRVAGAARPARAAGAGRAAGLDELRDPPLQPVDVLDAGTSRPICSRVLDERDVLLHHPYESFDPVVALVDAGGRRSRRARHQADALPHQRRLAHRRRPARARPSRASR